MSVQYGSYVRSQLLTNFRKGNYILGHDRNCSKMVRAFLPVGFTKSALRKSRVVPVLPITGIGKSRPSRLWAVPSGRRITPRKLSWIRHNLIE